MHTSAPNPFTVIKDATLNWWHDWVNQIVLNIVWALCWLTIILGPPATFALYEASSELVRGTAVGLRDMVDSGKQYFLKSWLWLFVNLGVALALVSNYLYYRQLAQAWAIWAEYFVIMLASYWIIIQFYAIPFFMLQTEKSLRLAWRNALVTILKTPIFTIVIILYAVIVLAISVGTGLLLFLGGIPLITILGCQAVRQQVKAELKATNAL